jgi:glycosyltransferase involved in cell wall biosynthesis
MNELVESADLIIYPSRFEGFGLSLLEALHKGIPVMCTNGWPMNELQTIQDPRLLIEVSKTVPLRLAWSFEPKAESIVANLVAIKKKKLSKLFPVSEVTRGLKERQDTFRIQIQSIVNNLMKMA